MMTGMFGIELVATTLEGKRKLFSERVNEFGGYLTTDEGRNAAVEEFKNYTGWNRYEKIEVYDFNLKKKDPPEESLVHTVYGKDYDPR